MTANEPQPAEPSPNRSRLAKWLRWRYVIPWSAVLLVIVSWGAVWWSIERQCVTNRFVIPNGFQGAIRIRPFISTGVEPTVVDGIRTFVVPQGGLLELSGECPYRTWEQTEAVYENNQSLPIDSDFYNYEDDEYARRQIEKRGGLDKAVAFWTLFGDGNGGLWCYVGTKEEMAAASSKPNSLAPGERVKSPNNRTDDSSAK